MARLIGGLVAGLIVGVVTIAVIEAVGMYVFPPPAGVESQDPEIRAEAIRNLSSGSFASVLLAWFVGTFLAAMVATRIGGVALWPTLVIAGCFEPCGIAMLIMIPSPWWFNAIGSALFFPAALAGHMLVKPEPAEPPAA